MPTKKPSAKQLAARAKFVKMVRAKAAKSKAAKKVGAIKIVEKGENKLTRPKKVYQQTRSKSGTFKSLKRIAGTTKHKDTKSHNVKINVMSGVNTYAMIALKDSLERLASAEKNLSNVKNTLASKTFFYNKVYTAQLKKDSISYAQLVKDIKKHITQLKKHIK